MSNAIQSVKEKLTSLLPKSTIEMACPKEFEGVSIPYWNKSYLLLMPDTKLVFLIMAGKGKQRGTLQAAIRKIKRPAVAILFNGNKSDLVLFGKASEEHLNIEELGLQRLLKIMSEAAPEIEAVRSKEDISNFTPDYFRQIKPEQAPELEKIVNQLTHGLINIPSNAIPDIWQEIAHASLRILPEAAKKEALANSAIDILARSTIFLMPPEKFNAVKQILDMSLKSEVGSETKERLSSVAYAMASSLKPEYLAQLIPIIRQKISPNEKISPSLAQIISLAQTRTKKTN